MNRTYVYVDGFNLFYGSLKGTDYKWLNIRKLCESYLPASLHNIRKIYYFTALVSGTDDDPDKPQRQQKYVRALKTLPDVEIIAGRFITDRLILERVDGKGPIEVIRRKEKASDVNLASMLLWDAHKGNFDKAVLITGDSDFHTPVKIIRHYFKKEIGILDPQHGGAPNTPMNKEATFFKPIRQKALREAQFPDKMTDAKGEFWRPQEWFAKVPDFI